MALLAIAMMASLGANAQLAGKGAITGTVTDTTGALIPGATVSAINTANGIATTTTSSGGGNYIFSDLDPGIYTLTTTAKGFEKLVQENIHVNALESQSYNPVLAVGNANVQITVTAEPPQLETSNAVLGSTMENKEYSELPIEMGAYGQADQRRATDFAFLMPGVQANNTNGNATTNTGVVNGSGSRGAASDVYVDGIPFVRAGGNGDPRYVWTAISVDAVDQMQVQTNGYSAMYEGQGVMNYSIKQGGQQFHGSVYEFFRNTRLDSWGFFRAQLPDANGLEQAVKPVEHMNEYGIAIGGPLIPFGDIKNKLFFFTNYNGFRFASENPTPMRYPTTAEMGGDFSADGVALYDPASYTPGGTCAGGTTNCRTQFKTGGVNNVIPANRIPAFVTNMQKFLPAISSTAPGNNFTAPNKTGLNNWSSTSRIDYAVDSRDTLTVVGSVGRQASSNPVGQTTAGRNVGPVPFNYGQTYAPKTAVWAVELTHLFSPNLINQLKWGYARYNGPTFNPDDSTKYSATTMGLSGMPTGQAQSVFPITTFSGGAVVPTNWGGTTENRTVAENYTVLDTLNWNVGKHSLTVGGQVAWMLYNVVNATNTSSPLTLANAVSETAQVNSSSTTTSGTGLPYASFLLGEVDKGSFTSYLQNEFGARFRAISPYFQDDWKVNSKLTVNLGLRYDYYPTITEVHNAEGFFNPTLANPLTGLNGALQFTGSGTNTCNCSTPVKNYYKNWGPRLGAAYQLGSKTVVRASWGVMFSHGDAVGGLASSLGTLGFSAAPTFSSSLAQTSMTGLLPVTGGGTGTGVIPTYTLASGAASGPAYGTGYAGNSTAPSSMQYNDPYLGGRAPEYLNWNFGVQRQIINTITATVNYVGSEGHFLQLDSNHARGYWADDLDPKYIALLGYNVNASHLSDTSNLATDCTTYSLPCPSATLMANTKQALSTFLKPFPFQAVGDTFGYVGNSNYHALQAVLSVRRWHGLTLTASYTFSKVIDDGGSFRTGYPIPAGTMANHLSQAFAADRYERGVSTSNQPQHFVATAVWDWPFGRSFLAGNPIERAILGGFTWSGVYQQFSGSPLALTESSAQTNPAQTTNMPIINPNFTGPVRVNGKWGKGTMGTTYYNGTLPNTADTITNPSYIASSTGTSVATAAGPFMNPVSGILSSYNYLFSDAPRTAPYGLYGPGNYQADIAMIRSFPLHITEATKLDFRAELYNLTNHTFFGVANTAVGNASFGQATNNGSLNRKSAQFSARIEF
ncbi:MAG TPA: carboxypeptidase regulatory-like domain-containing protein [Terracidiphilus sp.]|nr:carboxypeptidase regulatory-like domain-containing protein [Terracidiphilus sp.]